MPRAEPPFELGPLIAAVKSAAADLLFPPTCCGCGGSLPAGESVEFCGGCAAELALIAGAACGKCGAPAARQTDDARCLYCQGLVMRFDRAVAVGVHEGLLRRLVLAAKHTSGEGVSAVLGRMAARRAMDCGVGPPDLVTCVPMHWRRRIARRHNSPEVMGEVVARELGAAFEPRLLRWTRRARKQADLSQTERRRNVRGAMRVRRGFRGRGAKVLVVDDVLTTGATCGEAARALRDVGAERVVAVVAARSL